MSDNFKEHIDETITIRNCKFAYKCDKQWFELLDTKDRNVKFCSTCQQEVFYCNTDEALVEAIKNNKCVCIETPYLTVRTMGKPNSEKIKRSK